MNKSIEATNGRREIDYGSAVKLSGNAMEVNYERFCEELGITDHYLARGIAAQIEALSSGGEDMKEENLKFMYSMVRALEPRNFLEVLRALQIGAVELVSMRSASLASKARSVADLERAVPPLNQLMRLSVKQMESYERGREGPAATVTVSNVTVEDGGQAVVGSVNGIMPKLGARREP